MIKKIIIFFFIKLFLCFSINAEEVQNFRVIDINYIMNSSEAGKSIIQTLDKINKKNLDELKNIEAKLEKAKKDLLSKKKILDENEFNKNVDVHQKKVRDYQIKKKKFLDDTNKKKVELSNKLLKVLNDILIEYSNENSIDAIFKKESILISQNKSDITNIILDRLNNKLNKID